MSMGIEARAVALWLGVAELVRADGPDYGPSLAPLFFRRRYRMYGGGRKLSESPGACC